MQHPEDIERGMQDRAPSLDNAITGYIDVNEPLC